MGHWQILEYGPKDETEACRQFIVLQKQAFAGKLAFIAKENDIALGTFLVEYLKHLAVISDPIFTVERVERIYSNWKQT